MRFCPNCGKEIPENINFCPYCGYKIPVESVKEEKGNDTSAENKVQVKITEQGNISNASKESKKESNMLSKLLFTFIVIAGAIFLFLNYSNQGSSFSKSNEIEKLVGTWYDPYNILLEKGDTITISYQGENAVGINTKGETVIKITPVGINRYQGHFVLYGVNSNNDVRYDESSHRLIFINRVTKMDISIKKH